MHHLRAGLAIAEAASALRQRTIVIALGRKSRHSPRSGGEKMDFITIAQVRDEGVARVMRVALRAHGFHPLEPGNGGLPGVPNLFGREGVGIDVPQDEAGDATVLVQQLLKDMGGGEGT
jgi:hypothetical protein